MAKSGAAKLEVEVIDLSVVIESNLKGIACVQGITDLGIIGKPIFIGSWIEFSRNLGGLLQTSDFPLYCKRALDSGAKLWVSPVGHYTDPADSGTLEGTKATGFIKDAALTTATITGVDQTGGAGANFFTVATDLTDKFVPGITFTVTGSTGNDGTYTVVSSVFGTDTDIVVVEVIGDITVDGDTNYSANFAEYAAKEVGAKYNAVTITSVVSANGVADEFDISIVVDGLPDNSETVLNLAKAPTANEITAFNNTSKLIDLISVEVEMVAGTTPLAGGVQTLGNIVTADYAGDQVGQTGLYAFDPVVDAIRIATPEIADPVLDIATVTYVETRKDMHAILRTPLGIADSVKIDYREGTGIYTHAAIDSYFAQMETGDLVITDPILGGEKTISAIGDILGLKANSDTKRGEWFASAGPKRGRIKNALGFADNLGSPSKSATLDQIDVHGLNASIDHPAFGPVSWGNNTLQKASTKLKFANIAELILFVTRSLGSLGLSELFDPNDVTTWKAIYLKNKPLFDFLASNRALNGQENIGWIYQGDQNVDNVEDAIINQPANVDAGEYVARIFIKPTGALKFILIKVIITNTSVDFEVLLEEPNL